MDRKELVAALNAPKVIADHTFGKEHTLKHRMMIGLVLTVVGTLLFDMQWQAHLVTETLGVLVQAVGGGPFIEWLSSFLED